MTRDQLIDTAKIVLASIFCLLLVMPLSIFAAEVTLQWDYSDPDPAGYKLFQRQAGQQDFEEIWTGSETSYTVTGLTEGTTYYFVVRAFTQSLESENSNEVQFIASDAASSGDDNLEKPLLSQPSNGADQVSLTPTLITEAISGNSFGTHARTCYQISTNADFTGLVFEQTYSQHLTSLSIPDLILEPDTTYYWRVKYFDLNNDSTQWSDAFSFITIGYAAAGDTNGNGILDSQEIHGEIDLDRDGRNDDTQGDLQAMKTMGDLSSFVAVKPMDRNVQVGNVLSLDQADLSRAINQSGALSDVMGYKLYLMNDTTSATVTVYFSEPAPDDALWYTYDPEDGWQVSNQAVFSADRLSVTLTLEDGGVGDQDGVANGIIVDLAGLGGSADAADSTTGGSSSSGGSGCFIATSANNSNNNWIYIGLLFFLSGTILLFKPIIRKTA